VDPLWVCYIIKIGSSIAQAFAIIRQMATAYKAPLGASLVVLSSLFYASYGVWTKLMGDYFDGFTSTIFRSFFVIVVLAPVLVANKSWVRINWKRDGKYLFGMLVASSLVWGPLYYAILKLGVGVSAAVNYGAIVIGMFLFGWLLAREKFTKDKLLSCVLGFVGLSLVFINHSAAFSVLPLLAATVSGIAIAANMVIAKQIPYSGTQSTILLWLASLLSSIALCGIFQVKVPVFELQIEWLYLVMFSLASLVASWTFVRGTKLIDAGAAGVLGLLEIVFGVLFGIVIFSERPGVVVLLGALVIIAAAAIPYLKDYNAKRGTLG
jgi:drug/metabolite transporter (DMT)-like permease